MGPSEADHAGEPRVGHRLARPRVSRLTPTSSELHFDVSADLGPRNEARLPDACAGDTRGHVVGSNLLKIINTNSKNE